MSTSSINMVIPVTSGGAYLNGIEIPLDSVPFTMAYSGSFISTITITWLTHTYVQTYTNNGTNITAISGWVQQ